MKTLEAPIDRKLLCQREDCLQKNQWSDCYLPRERNRECPYYTKEIELKFALGVRR